MFVRYVCQQFIYKNKFKIAVEIYVTVPVKRVLVAHLFKIELLLP